MIEEIDIKDNESVVVFKNGTSKKYIVLPNHPAIDHDYDSVIDNGDCGKIETKN